MPDSLSRCIAVFAAAFACVVSVPAQSRAVTHDIPYVAGTHAKTGDLYEPGGGGPFPAILYIHGGSWRSGSKSDFKRLATDLAAKGYVGFSIDYDLQPGSYPLSWQQAEEAVRFLREHAAEYKIDPKRIAVVGTSAGGEIAALLAMAPEGPAHPAAGIASDATSDRVQAAVMLNSVYDLTGHYGVIKRYIGGECKDVHEACLESSPMQHIHEGEPPFFVGHGTSDHTVPYRSAELFTTDMKAAGNAVTFFKADGGGHMYFTKSKFYDDNLAAVEAFLAGTIGAGQP